MQGDLAEKWEQAALGHFHPRLCTAFNPSCAEPAQMWGEQGAASLSCSFCRGDEGLLPLDFSPSISGL